MTIRDDHPSDTTTGLGELAAALLRRALVLGARIREQLATRAEVSRSASALDRLSDAQLRDIGIARDEVLRLNRVRPRESSHT